MNSYLMLQHDKFTALTILELRENQKEGRGKNTPIHIIVKP